MSEKYNGWTNYETLNVSLWIGNDQNSYEYWGQIAQDLYDAAEADSILTRDERATLDIADRLKDEFETASQELLENAKATASVWADLLGAALSEVNWHEIAEHLMEGVDKAEAAETE